MGLIFCFLSDIFHLGSSAKPASVSVLLEDCGSSLEEILAENLGCPLPEVRIKDVMRDIGSALEHLGGLGIVHRAVCPKSIFSHPKGIFKLGELSRAAHADILDKDSGTRKVFVEGEPGYTAPQVL